MEESEKEPVEREEDGDTATESANRAHYHYSAYGPVRLRPRQFAMRPISARGTFNLILGILIGALLIEFVATSSLSSMATLRQRLGLPSGYSMMNGPVASQQLSLQESSAVISAAKKAAPSVVAITASQQVTNFFGQSSSQETSAGSGFIITANGLILTNKHVVSENGATYKVVLNDGRVFDATVQATDPLNDLAVVKINATDLPVAALGNSSALQVGQQVLAIGNALGQFQNSVTLGIVSATNRSISPSDGGTTEDLTDLIQTDAAINPGNSGGPLVDMDGQVVGIDTAIASTSGGSVGIGFAIPVDDFTAVISSVAKTGKISVPYLGVRYTQVNTTLKQLDSLSVDYGALVSGDASQGAPAVISGSPADSAGIKEGDIILQLNGTKIDSSNTLQHLLQQHQPGDQVTLTILRSGKQSDIKVTLGSQG